MTCIAYRDGVLASEGRVTMKGFIDQDDCKKIYRLPDGSLFGAAGDYAGSLVLYHLLIAQAKQKKKTNKDTSLPSAVVKRVSALLVSPGRVLWFYEAGVWEKLRRDYLAIGSGYEIATVAMDYGATAKEAVKTACRRLSSCGGKIHTLTLS